MHTFCCVLALLLLLLLLFIVSPRALLRRSRVVLVSAQVGNCVPPRSFEAPRFWRLQRNVKLKIKLVIKKEINK